MPPHPQASAPSQKDVPLWSACGLLIWASHPCYYQHLHLLSGMKPRASGRSHLQLPGSLLCVFIPVLRWWLTRKPKEEHAWKVLHPPWKPTRGDCDWAMSFWPCTPGIGMTERREPLSAVTLKPDGCLPGSKQLSMSVSSRCLPSNSKYTGTVRLGLAWEFSLKMPPQSYIVHSYPHPATPG